MSPYLLFSLVSAYFYTSAASCVYYHDNYGTNNRLNVNNIHHTIAGAMFFVVFMALTNKYPGAKTPSSHVQGFDQGFITTPLFSKYLVSKRENMVLNAITMIVIVVVESVEKFLPRKPIDKGTVAKTQSHLSESALTGVVGTMH